MSCNGIQVQPGCCPSCTLSTDTFDRDAIGSNWSVQSGTWTCATTGGGQLTTSSSNAELDYAPAMPPSVNFGGRITVSGSIGDTVGFGWLHTSGQYTKILLTFGATRNTVSIFYKDVQQGDDLYHPPETTTTLGLCNTDFEYTAFQIDNAGVGQMLIETEVLGDGKWVVLTGSISDTITWTNFQISTNWGFSGSDCDCAGGCVPCFGAPPTQIQIDFPTGFSGSVAHPGANDCGTILDGQTFVMDIQSDASLCPGGSSLCCYSFYPWNLFTPPSSEAGHISAQFSAQLEVAVVYYPGGADVAFFDPSDYHSEDDDWSCGEGTVYTVDAATLFTTICSGAGDVTLTFLD